MESTGPGSGSPSAHVGVPYSDPGSLAEMLAPTLVPALAAGGSVLAVLGAPEQAALRSALGADSAGVEFAEPALVHAVPPFTVAARWTRLAREVAGAGGRTLVVEQQVPTLPGLGVGHWARLDLALDVAMAQLPLTVLCAVPTFGSDALHPFTLEAGRFAPNAGHRDPLTAVREHPPPAAVDLGPPGAELDFTVSDLHTLRLLTSSFAEAAGLEPGRVDDFVLAVNELASNSVEHGPGSGRLRAWSDADGVTAEVHDTGTVDIPFPGLVAPPVDGARGRGLWMAAELTDVLQAWTGQAGTTFRVWSARKH